MNYDDIYPRDELHRYRLYKRTELDGLELLAAAPDAGGIGQAIFTLNEEAGGQLWLNGRLGILDAILSRWIVNPWSK